uniref:Uncharacterized protein n=1 Tax=Aegilops tauschii TaxID=37682 RepID=M8B7B7_AEGTA
MKLNRVSRRRRDLLKVDRLIKLPDHVLLNILERLGMLDAVRTCLVSKQTLNLPALLSRIVVDFSDGDLRWMNRDVADATDKILSTRSPGIPVRMLKLRFIMRGDDHLKIGRAVALAMATQKIYEAEFEILTKDVYYKTTDADLLDSAKMFNSFIDGHIVLTIPCSLVFVPRLSKLSLTNAYHSSNNHKLSQLLVNVPSISDLHLDFLSEKIWVQPECRKLVAPVLSKLRLVNLNNLPEECDISWTLFFLEAAPSVEELSITIWDHKCQMESQKSRSMKTDVKWEPSTPDFKHKNLAKLTIYGFQSDDNFMEYVRRAIQAVVNIKEVSLHDRKVCKLCTHKFPHIGVRPSSYPRTSEEVDLFRKKITEAKAGSHAMIHLRTIGESFALTMAADNQDAAD